jgi:LmbE family N-acetylglucosaminyl deacetylase
VSSRSLCVAGSLLLALGMSACLAPGVAVRDGANAIERLELLPGERMLVMVPHPDDEILCCAGLMARVMAEGGSVHLVYATHGDGYREAVAAEAREVSPGPALFRAYGERRRRESLAVLEQLRVPEGQARFLGFPDGGLRALWDHRFDAAGPYRSRTTAADTPPYLDSPARGRPYTAQQLGSELTRALAEVRPTLLVIPDARDQHGDHNALGLFSLEAVAASTPTGAAPTRILSYLVHWRTWPDASADGRAPLEPPGDFEVHSLGWRVLPLAPAATAEKRRLLHLYATQMTAMGGFLERFPRRNELFGELDDASPRFVSARERGAALRPIP